MSGTLTRARTRSSAVLLALLLLGPGNLFAQQRLGRQQDLTLQRVDSLRSQIQELGGRAIIGFKPVEAAQGMRPDGTPALDQSTVRIMAESLGPMGVVVLRQFQRIPAVAVRMDPTRLEELLANPDIDYVEPDVLHEPTGLAEVPDLMALPVQEIPWGILRVNAPDAWAITRGAGAKLGIIDTGIDEDHPDLNVLDGINLVTGGTARSDWDDNSAFCITHGTHVAGSAAALDNDLAVVGVAPLAELYALRVFDPENSGTFGCFAFTSDIIAALEWAVDNTMDVVNLSLGSTFPSLAEGDAVFATFSAGVVVVASAGNSFGSVSYPAGYPDAIAVAAMDEFEFVAFFSSHGPEVDVAGPGVNVLSTWGGGGTAFLQGTSMASPHAAGVATLIRSASPGLSAADVREILRNTADDIADPGYDYFAGNGVVDAEAAVNAVGTASFALSTVPGLLTLTAEPGGSPVTEAVEIRNVGAAGTINWTASEVETWLSLSAASGTATDVTPGSFDVIADPTGLDPGIYTGFVTVAGNAANSPVQTRVRFAVAPRIVLDAAVATAGEIPNGKRTRFVFGGTAGQLIDVAVLTDFDHVDPLFDPVLRVIMPDGETVLEYSEQGFVAGLASQPLIFTLQLPEDGDYFVEVGARRDLDFFGRGFILKARESGPILGLFQTFLDVRAEEGTVDPAQATVDLFNLTDIGSLSFTTSTSDPWLSTDPSSGTVELTGLIAATARASFSRPKDDPLLDDFDPTSLEGELGDWWRARTLAPNLDSLSLPDSHTTRVTVFADPTGLSAGTQFGTVTFTPSDDWLPPISSFVQFRVYSQGMKIISEGHFAPWGVTTDIDGPDQAIGASLENRGTLFALGVEGLRETVASDLGLTTQPGGLTEGGDGNWYLVEAFGFNVIRVFPDGNSELFATVPGSLRAIATGPAGEFYVSSCGRGLHRISPDATVIEPFAPSFTDCSYGIAYNPLDESLYVSSLSGRVHKVALDGSDGGIVAEGMGGLTGLAIGQSGRIYVVDFDGLLWAIDPEGPGTIPEVIGFTPSSCCLMDVALVEGAVIISSQSRGEFFSFPVDDNPVGPGLFITIHLDADDIVNLGGLAKSIPGEDFKIPLNIETTADATAVANYVVELTWDVDRLEFLDLAHDFSAGPGTFIANTTLADQGSLQAAGAEPEGRGAGGGVFTLFTLDLVVNEALVAGEVVVVSIEASEVSGPLNEDLLSTVVAVPGQICLSEFPMGDLTLDGRVSAADATQILRQIVGLPLAPGADLDRGDVTGDGDAGVGDVVDILRNLVALPIPASSRLGKPPLESCP